MIDGIGEDRWDGAEANGTDTNCRSWELDGDIVVDLGTEKSRWRDAMVNGLGAGCGCCDRDGDIVDDSCAEE